MQASTHWLQPLAALTDAPPTPATSRPLPSRHPAQALRIPVLGNGNIRTLHDCEELMQATGVDGVMSAESLLVDPALFSRRRLQVQRCSVAARLSSGACNLDCCCCCGGWCIVGAWAG